MLSDSEKKTIESYLERLAEDERQRSEIAARMQRREVAIRAILANTDDEEDLAPYLEKLDEILKPSGFTDAVRKVFRQSPDNEFTPVEVKQKMSVRFVLSGYTNPLASIHTILKRLVKAGEVVPVQREDGKSAYRLKGWQDYEHSETDKGAIGHAFDADYPGRKKLLLP
jgi:hypothetical protein